MISEEKIKRMLSVADNYAADQCYLACDRQVQLAFQAVIRALAETQNLTLEQALAFQRMAQLLRDR